MAGVRIRHVTARNATLTLVDSSRKYIAPILCIRCGATHQFKTYHVTLDDVGTAIVSPEIAAHLTRMGAVTGFAIVGDVAKPPAIIVGLPGHGSVLDLSTLPPIVVHDQLTEPGRG